jgi:hypothetical protein
MTTEQKALHAYVHIIPVVFWKGVLHTYPEVKRSMLQPDETGGRISGYHFSRVRWRTVHRNTHAPAVHEVSPMNCVSRTLRMGGGSVGPNPAESTARCTGLAAPACITLRQFYPQYQTSACACRIPADAADTMVPYGTGELATTTYAKVMVSGLRLHNGGVRGSTNVVAEANTTPGRKIEAPRRQ